MFVIALAGNPAFADVSPVDQGYLFIGTPYERANGHTVRNSTTFKVLKTEENGASGEVSHREEMGSFDLLFSVNCTDHRFEAHADINGSFAPQYAVSFRAFPEWLEVRFPEGGVASIGSDFAAPPATEIAKDRFFSYVDAGEPQAPLGVLVDGITSEIIYRHANRLRFITEGMIAQSCMR